MIYPKARRSSRAPTAGWEEHLAAQLISRGARVYGGAGPTR